MDIISTLFCHHKNNNAKSTNATHTVTYTLVPYKYGGNSIALPILQREYGGFYKLSTDEIQVKNILYLRNDKVEICRAQCHTSMDLIF